MQADGWEVHTEFGSIDRCVEPFSSWPLLVEVGWYGDPGSVERNAQDYFRFYGSFIAKELPQTPDKPIQVAVAWGGDLDCVLQFTDGEGSQSIVPYPGSQTVTVTIVQVDTSNGPGELRIIQEDRYGVCAVGYILTRVVFGPPQSPRAAPPPLSPSPSPSPSPSTPAPSTSLSSPPPSPRPSPTPPPSP
eukprot:131316-Pleurochrysis_carterae.AAC.1